MKIIDCFWENKNLGVKTSEITISSTDIVNLSEFKELEEQWDYIVVKCIETNIETFQQLSSLHYFFIETQITLEKELVITHIDDSVQIDLAQTTNEINFVTERINEGLFDTDRIALDPQFGIRTANTRYSNWLLDEIKRGAKLLNIKKDGKKVGFILLKEDNQTIDVILHGIYKQYQKQHLGSLLAICPSIYVQKFNSNIKYYQTKVSSNNPGILRIMTKYGYKVTDISYVFVKHSKHEL